MMSKSELIEKITAEHEGLTKKDVKGVLESLATVGYKELKKSGTFLVPGFAKFVVIKKPATKEAPAPRIKEGKKLLTAMDLMKIASVSTPRISPDGARVAYAVSEVKMEKDKEWKTVSQIWVVAIEGEKPRQFTRGDKSSSAPEWSTDGKMLAFLSDREKDGERQVWMMMADGGEAWSVTSHKGGVSGFHFSPDGKRLVLTAVDQPSKDEEDRKKVKDDTMVIDHDIKMTHLWLFDIESRRWGAQRRLDDHDCQSREKEDWRGVRSKR